ncbi:MAG: preprotein translocase subunit SecE [Candidatus Brockarchaeota archaeon]|nr:preprotein translocase subunit SecE [Candidatus Brockarchaeota archaeon]
MPLANFLSSLRRLLRLADKPSRDDLWQSLKISFLGLAIVGVIAFFVQLVYALIQLAT